MLSVKGSRMRISVKPVAASNRSDFSRVHCEKNGEGWCNCVAWWVPTWEGWGARTATQNLALRNDLFDRGEYDGYLLYADDEPVGWCQCGPRDRLAKLVAQYRLEPSPDTWAVTCFVLAPPYRGRGLAVQLLKAVAADLAVRGVRHVQGFPRGGEALEPGEVWTGRESTFQAANFVVERAHEKFPVYGLKL